jgi:hypothetical protein
MSDVNVYGTLVPKSLSDKVVDTDNIFKGTEKSTTKLTTLLDSTEESINNLNKNFTDL